MASDQTPPTEPDEDEIERIWSEAENATVHAGHIASVVNPYADPMRAEMWSGAFRSAYARENGY